MSRNYEEDQKLELEALESIYYNELTGELLIFKNVEKNMVRLFCEFCQNVNLIV